MYPVIWCKFPNATAVYGEIYVGWSRRPNADVVHGLLIPWCFLFLPVYGIYSWWRHKFETVSALLALSACNSPVASHRWIPLTKASDAELWCFFDLSLNKRLSKQSWGWWFETPSLSLWRHFNVSLIEYYHKIQTRWLIVDTMATFHVSTLG